MLKCSNIQMFKCQMSNVKYQMSSVTKIQLLSECTSGVPPVIFFSRQHFHLIKSQVSYLFPRVGACYIWHFREYKTCSVRDIYRKPPSCKGIPTHGAPLSPSTSISWFIRKIIFTSEQVNDPCVLWVMFASGGTTPPPRPGMAAFPISWKKHSEIKP